MIYEYDTPEAAYKEAQRRIKKAKEDVATKLNLLGLGLTAVPPEIAQLSNLTELNLGSNQLTAVPPEIAQLTNLTSLDLKSNQLTAVPPEITQLSNLKELALSSNQLTAVPSEIAQLSSLEFLWLNHNKLTAVPLGIGQLSNLIILNLNDNQLTTVPPEIFQLSNLRMLYLNNNQLTAVPSEIAQLSNLTELYLHGNKLITFPPEITQLSNLKLLGLSGNKLTAVPPEITQLSNLTELNLGSNQLTAVPPEITRLTSLTELYLDDNQLTAVPPEIAQLINLKNLWLNDNPDLPIPPEIVAQWDNAQAILDYLREQQAEEARPLNEAKLILIGQGGVGKTSLVRRLLGNHFDPQEEQTKGIRIEKWQTPANRPQQGTVPITLNMWDFGGQEIMHATHQFFLTKRSLYLLVLDARQDEYKKQVVYWLSLIADIAADAPVIIVINKTDQRALDVDRRGLQKKYPNIIHDFILTSARDGSGIDTLKKAIAAALSKMAHVDTPFPASWMRVKNALIEMQAQHNFLPYHEYKQLCTEKGVEAGSSQRTLVGFLHDLGIALSFREDARVRHTSVLKPNWVTQGVYALLNNDDLQAQRGILHRRQLADILPAAEYPIDQHDFLLQMMLKFELAYELDRETLLIPDLLAEEEPAFAWEDENALQFAYQYAVLRYSILHRFMVRQHRFIDPKIRWRTGVLLQQDGLSALLKADLEAGTIRISIIGDGNRRQFLYHLRLIFADIHEAIAGTKPKEVVPIPHHPDAPPILYSYLEKLEGMRMPDEQLFPSMDQVLSVQQLLNGVSTPAMRQAGLLSRGDILANLRASFNKSEFHELLFELEIDRKDIEGDSVTDQMRECVLFMERNGRLPELLSVMRKR